MCLAVPSAGSLSACCDALEPRVKVDPRNGQPRTDQANIKAVCNSYKKTPPAGQSAPAPASASAPKQQASGSQECFAIETDLKVGRLAELCCLYIYMLRACL